MKVREPALRLSRAQRATVKDRQKVSRVERRVASNRQELLALRLQRAAEQRRLESDYEAYQKRLKGLRDRFSDRLKSVTQQRSEWRKERALLEALRVALKNEAYPLKVKTWNQSEPKPDATGFRQMIVHARHTFSQHFGGWILLQTEIEGIEGQD